MELAELFKVHAVAWFVQIEHSEDKARANMIAADPAGGLNIFGGGLGLPLDEHQS
jgi:hypothetical protein